MKYLNSIPKLNVPSFVKKYYQKYVVNDFLVQLAKWATLEFFDCVSFYAMKGNMRMWLHMRKNLSPAYVLASHPQFEEIIKSTSVEQWKKTDGKTINMFIEAYEIWQRMKANPAPAFA